MSDISTTSWAELDSGNNQQPSEGWPSGMNANAVEGSARMNMGAVKRFWNRVNPTYLAALSTTDTYTLAPTQAIAGYGLNERWRVRFPSANTTTSPTINISSIGAQTFQKYNGAGALVNPAVGDIQAQDHEFWWNGSQMVLTNPASASGTVTSVAANSDTTQGILVSGSPITGSGTIGLQLSPSRLPVKSPATASDSVVIMDNAAANAPKSAVIPDLRAALGLQAWGNIAANGTINASFNISAVSHQGTGVYLISFANALADANYAVIASGLATPIVCNPNTLTSSNFKIATDTVVPAAVDEPFTFIVMR